MRVCVVSFIIFLIGKKIENCNAQNYQARGEGGRGGALLQRLLMLLLRINNNKMRRAAATTKKYATKNINANIASA